MLKSISRLIHPQSEPSRQTYLIVGLGNPGREYRENRHNAGFMAIDTLANSMGVGLTRLQSKALVGQGELNGKRVILAKPQTYMNLSGQAVASLVKFYRIPLEQLLVVHDELDIPFGHLRIRGEGGTSGSRGMSSVIECLGTQDFPRLRIGIGRPAGSRDAADYVLENFARSEQQILSEVLSRAEAAIRLFIEEGIQAAMNRYNGPVNQD
jgi:peptidyl-tRNA hydrolase, PTH1 family